MNSLTPDVIFTHLYDIVSGWNEDEVMLHATRRWVPNTTLSQIIWHVAQEMGHFLN